MKNNSTEVNFERQFAACGGVNRLREMYNEGLSPSDIGREFDITSKQANYYLKRIIGDDYLRYPFRAAKYDPEFIAKITEAVEEYARATSLKDN